ncbi:MAG: TIGR01244 family phosphatase [Rhodobacterales bacterium]|nr:TIGR01244 family phosphatase [Rhodobacterales bacterium]
MDIRPLTELYAVSPQIAPEDLPAIRAAGYTTVIDNRPDAEIPADWQAAAMRAAAEAAGLTFVENPVIGGMLTEANVEAQARAIAEATGPVLAYCASGNRSSVVWALAMAGTLSADELIALPARHGYSLDWLRPALMARGG